MGTKANGSSDAQISPLELESLAASGSFDSQNSRGGLDRLAGSLPSHPCDKLMLLLKLYFELYPKIVLSASAFCVGLLLWAWAPWQSWGAASTSTRNYMTHDYTALQDNFNFQAAAIDHWCLFGGDDRCYCEDPTESMSRSEVHGWSNAHRRNKHKVEQLKKNVDVVFLGDQNVQSWDGQWLDRPAPEGSKIAKLFNDTFKGPNADFQGVALGIYGDRLNNILWRIQHGELPQSLRPKVFWLVMGTNDLALGMCSEEVVTLGIMRIAEEVHHLFPDSIVVIQGILPRSNHKDGSLDGGDKKNSARSKYNSLFRPGHTYSKRPTSTSNGKRPSSAGGSDVSQYMPMTPGGGRKLGEEASMDAGVYNQMDEFFDEYLEHYDDDNKTEQLLDDYVASIVEEETKRRQLQADPMNPQSPATISPPATPTANTQLGTSLQDVLARTSTRAPGSTTTAYGGTTSSTTSGTSSSYGSTGTASGTTTSGTTSSTSSRGSTGTSGTSTSGSTSGTTTSGTSTSGSTTSGSSTTSGTTTSSSSATTPTANTKLGQDILKRTSTRAPGSAPKYTRPKTTTAAPGTFVRWDSKGNIISKEERKSPQPYYDYYLWPSIQAINKELEGFCAKHEHFVYFDADDLVLGSIGNAHYKASHKSIIAELMPNYVHLSYAGHQVVMGALNDELKRIIYDDDEQNDIEKRSGGTRQ